MSSVHAFVSCALCLDIKSQTKSACPIMDESYLWGRIQQLFSLMTSHVWMLSRASKQIYLQLGTLFHSTRPTKTRKNMNYLTPYVCTETIFWQPTVHAPQNIFSKVCTSHIYASFGTFCVQIGQLFEAQWIFEDVWKSTDLCDLRKMSSISEFFRMFKDSLCRE